jgi:opacity protein-like surface antigen
MYLKKECKMKKVLMLALAVVLLLTLVGSAFADEYVGGYTRHDGTYVAPHYRSSPNGTVTDNWSFKGNTNPYTGREGTDYYRHNPTSPYYDGSPRLGR